jgi:hypothetical protein
MKKLLIDSVVSLFIIIMFIPIMVVCMIAAAWEFAVTWPRQMIEIVNDYHDNNAGKDTQI